MVRSLTFRSSHSMSSLGLFHSLSRSAYFFFSSFSFSRSCHMTTPEPSQHQNHHNTSTDSNWIKLVM